MSFQPNSKGRAMKSKSCIARSPGAWKRWSSVTCIAMSAWMMTACASSTAHLPAAPIPANLLQPCPPLEPLEGKTGADVLRKLVEIGEAYNGCADGKAALIKAVR
jgi:hypothetical protein